MINHLIHTLFFCLALLLAPLFAYEDIYETLVIEKIDLQLINAPQGSTINVPTIMTRMKSQEGHVFSQTDFDEDLKLLSADYEDIDPILEIVNGKIHITLNISLRPHIRTMRWHGNSSLSSRKLQGELKIAPGSIFDRTALNRALLDVKKYYIKNGYFESEIDYEVEYDAATNEVDIVLNVNEGRSGRIKEIVFHNFSCDEESDIIATMITQKWNIIFSFFTDCGIYNEDAVLQDQYVIVNYLQNRGYADATVTIEPVTDCTDPKRIVVHVTACKGERYSFGKVSFEGNCVIDSKAITRALDIYEGECFSPEKLHAASERIRTLYGCRGYIDAFCEFEPTLDGECPIYHIHFNIEEGEQYRVGLIRVLGNYCTAASVILHECLLVPGEIFNVQKIKATEERLRNIGYFSCVNVYAVRAEDTICEGSQFRDVHIELVETNTGNVSAFVGLSSFENIYGGFNICEKNFRIQGLMDWGQKGLSAFRGGGEYAYFSTTIGAKSLVYKVNWAKPYFLDTPWLLGVEFDRSNIRYVSDQYNLDAWGIKVYGKYPLNAYLSAGTHWRVRNSNVVLDLEKKTIDEKLLLQSQTAGLISAVGLSLFYDSTNHPLMPSNGLRARLEGEFAGMGGDSVFFVAGYFSQLYLPFTKFGVVKFQAELKYIIPCAPTSFGTIPIDERIFLGGIQGVRGFRDFALGPFFGSDRGDPTGGISKAVFSVEYVYRYFGRFEPFVFADIGQISDRTLSFSPFAASAGFGIRAYLIPNSGPLTLGFGFPFANPYHNDKKCFFFSMGGSF